MSEGTPKSDYEVSSHLTPAHIPCAGEAVTIFCDEAIGELGHRAHSGPLQRMAKRAPLRALQVGQRHSRRLGTRTPTAIGQHELDGALELGLIKLGKSRHAFGRLAGKIFQSLP